MTARAAAVAEAMRDVAEVLAGPADALDLAHRLVGHCVALLGASAAGLVVQDGTGRLQLLAASSSAVRVVELFQLQADEGPCVECYRTGEPVLVPDRAAMRRRWPRFAAAAESQGVRAVHTAPLTVLGRTVGALNLFRDRDGVLDESDGAVAAALASLGAVGIVQLEHAAAGRLVQEQLQRALDSRVVLEQAKGALAERHRIEPDHAFQLLRAEARRTSRRLQDVASDVLRDVPAAVEAGPPAVG